LGLQIYAHFLILQILTKKNLKYFKMPG
jgi:hypothetical protein